MKIKLFVMYSVHVICGLGGSIDRYTVNNSVLVEYMAVDSVHKC
jgi:hypothetical protein